MNCCRENPILSFFIHCTLVVKDFYLLKCLEKILFVAFLVFCLFGVLLFFGGGVVSLIGFITVLIVSKRCLHFFYLNPITLNRNTNRQLTNRKKFLPHEITLNIMQSLLLMRDKNTATKNEQAQRFLGHANVTMLLWKLIGH